MKTLVIVDFQNDFCNPNGTLFVNGAIEAKKHLIDYIKTNHDLIDSVILTRDWHKECDKSFKNNGGIWPVHCVEGTWGSEVDNDIINILNELNINYIYSNKGTNPDVEEYGAFSAIYETEEGIALQNVNDSYVTLIPNNKTNVVVCGIAGDYCVYETTKNLIESKLFNVELFHNGIASIDNGEKISKIMELLNNI